MAVCTPTPSTLFQTVTSTTVITTSTVAVQEPDGERLSDFVSTLEAPVFHSLPCILRVFFSRLALTHLQAHQ